MWTTKTQENVQEGRHDLYARKVKTKVKTKKTILNHPTFRQYFVIFIYLIVILMSAVASILLLYKRQVTDSKSSTWYHQPNPSLLAPTPAFFLGWAAGMSLTQPGQGISHRNMHAATFFQLKD